MENRVKITALGGLDEKGKCLYVVEIDEEIYVLDGGIKFPDRSLPGVDLILPDYTYLKENKDRVVCYLLSQGYSSHCGAIPYIYRDVPAPIYCSKATAVYLERFAKMMLKKSIAFDFHCIDPNDDVIIDKRKIRFFQTASSSICTSGIAIDTDMGPIVYTGQFIVEYNCAENHAQNLNKLAHISKKNVLCLLSESVGADQPGYTAPNHKLTSILHRTLVETRGRTFVSLFDHNIYGFEEVLKVAASEKKKVIFYNQFTQEMYDMLAPNGLYVPPRGTIVSSDELLRTRENDLMIVIMQQGESLFNELSSLARGEIEDRRFLISPNDTFLMASPAGAGLEIIATEAIDDLYRTGAKIVNLKRKQYISMIAHEEDLKAMISILKPKYYFPVTGEFRQLLSNARMAAGMGTNYSHNNVFVMDNGMTLEIDEKHAQISPTPVRVGDLYVDGIGVGDVRQDVISDRQKLSEDGVIVAAMTVSQEQEKIIAGPDIQMRGFVFLKESEGVLKEVQRLFIETIQNALSMHKELKDAKELFIEKSNRYIWKETGRKPMIVAIVEVLENF